MFDSSAWDSATIQAQSALKDILALRELRGPGLRRTEIIPCSIPSPLEPFRFFNLSIRLLRYLHPLTRTPPVNELMFLGRIKRSSEIVARTVSITLYWFAYRTANLVTDYLDLRSSVATFSDFKWPIRVQLVAANEDVDGERKGRLSIGSRLYYVHCPAKNRTKLYENYSGDDL